MISIGVEKLGQQMSDKLSLSLRYDKLKLIGHLLRKHRLKSATPGGVLCFIGILSYLKHLFQLSPIFRFQRSKEMKSFCALILALFVVGSVQAQSLKAPKETAMDRFLRYVKIDTQSAEDQTTVPSTRKQLVLANLLAKEL